METSFQVKLTGKVLLLSENHKIISKALRLGMKNVIFSIISLLITNLIQHLQFLKGLATLMKFQIHP